MKLILFLFFNLIRGSLNAQVADSSNTTGDSIGSVSVTKTLCLLTGINYSHHVFSDIGLSVNFSSSGGIHPVSASYYFANEIHLLDKPFIGPKLGFSINLLITRLAANVIYYTDFKKQNTFALRPEIGFGINRFRIMYGFNKILNKSVDRLSKNNLGLFTAFT